MSAALENGAIDHKSILENPHGLRDQEMSA